MVLSHGVVAILAIAGYELLRRAFARGGEAASAGSVRAVVVLTTLVVALPLGGLLGSITVSALAKNLAYGSVVLVGSLGLLTLLGIGLYTAAEGELPAVLRWNAAE